MLEAISILLAWLLGFLLIQALNPVGSIEPRWAAVLFNAALGTGVGMGVASIIFLLLDVTGAASPAAIFGIDIGLVALLAWRWFRTRSGRAAPSSSDVTAPGYRWTWLLAIAFGAVLLISGVRLVEMAVALPVGEWDAWTLWNLRAKFLAGPGDSWRYALSPLLYGTHPDYPLLLSAFIARVWKAGGGVNEIAPVVTAFAFFVALLALVVSSVALLRGAASGLLAGLVLLSTTSLLIWTPAQYADIPLAFFYLGAIALIFLGESARGHAQFWAGLCAGLAAWTKNEGVAFLICILIVFLTLTLWQRRTRAAIARAGWLLAGAIPGVLLTLWLKLWLAPPVNPLSGLSRLRDASRYAQVAEGFFKNLLHLGSGVSHPLILLAILCILLRWQVEERYEWPLLIAATGLALVFSTYFGELVMTPWSLDWQLQTSLDRLILQVWPSFLLVFFVALRNIADVAIPSAPVKNAVTRKSPAISGKRAPAGRKLKGV